MLALWSLNTTTTTGTGALTLSTVSGFPSLSDTIGIGVHFYYVISNDSDNSPIEAGMGYLSDSTTLQRSKVFATYNSGVFVNTNASVVSLASGTKKVYSSIHSAAVQTAWPAANSIADLGLQKFTHSAHLSNTNSSSTAGITVANNLYIIPFELKVGMDLTGLGVRCGTGIASSTIRLGVYSVGPDGNANKLIAETTDLSTATSGVDVIGSVTRQRLVAGLYYVSFVTTHTPSLGRVDGAGSVMSAMGPNTGNLMSTVLAMRTSYAYGALPSTAPTSGFIIINSNIVPTIFMRYA